MNPALVPERQAKDTSIVVRRMGLAAPRDLVHFEPECLACRAWERVDIRIITSEVPIPRPHPSVVCNYIYLTTHYMVLLDLGLGI